MRAKLYFNGKAVWFSLNESENLIPGTQPLQFLQDIGQEGRAVLLKALEGHYEGEIPHSHAFMAIHRKVGMMLQYLALVEGVPEAIKAKIRGMLS